VALQTVSEKVGVFTTCTDRRMWLLVMALVTLLLRQEVGRSNQETRRSDQEIRSGNQD
jgi:hypothetical protein